MKRGPSPDGLASLGLPRERRNPRRWIYRRLHAIELLRPVAAAITRFTRSEDESWEAWRERLGQPARDFIERLLIRATDHPETLQPHEFRMVERFTKQVMEYELRTPTQCVEISGGRGRPSLSDFNASAREYAAELVAELRAADERRSQLPTHGSRPVRDEA